MSEPLAFCLSVELLSPSNCSYCDDFAYFVWYLKAPKAEPMRPDFGLSEPTFLFLIYVIQLQIVCDSN